MTGLAAGAPLSTTAQQPPTELPAEPKTRFQQFIDRFGWNGAVVIEIFLLVILWQFLTRGLHLWPASFVPAPTEVGESLVNYFSSGRMASDASYSFVNFIVGYLLAVVIGSTLGFLLGTWARLRAGAQPFLWIFYATPRVAIQPLLLIWLGFGNAPKILIVFLLAFFPIVFIVMEGVRDIDPSLLRAGKVYGIRGRERYTKILLPASMPFLLTGLRIGLARGLVGMVIGEFIGGNQGLGYRILASGQEFKMDQLLAVTFIIMILANLSLAVLAWTKRKFAPWAEE